MIKIEINEELDRNIKAVLEQLDKAVENSKKYYAVEVDKVEYQSNDFFETALAFDTVELLMARFELLLAKRYKISGWEQAAEIADEQIKRLDNNITHWEKREFPSRQKIV